MKKLVLAALFGAAAVAAPAQAAVVNLITNGDFEAGDTGFTTDFTQSALQSGAQTYAIVTDPRSSHRSATSYGDHTTGTGLMMAVNGSTNSTAVIWSQSVAVDANTAYEFSGWFSSWFSPGTIQLRINGENVGSSFNTPSTNGLWEQIVLGWASGNATTALIELVNTSTQFGGNDFAIDDLSFVSLGSTNPVPLPAAAWLFIAGAGGITAMRKAKAKA